MARGANNASEILYGEHQRQHEQPEFLPVGWEWLSGIDVDDLRLHEYCFYRGWSGTTKYAINNETLPEALIEDKQPEPALSTICYEITRAKFNEGGFSVNVDLKPREYDQRGQVSSWYFDHGSVELDVSAAQVRLLSELYPHIKGWHYFPKHQQLRLIDDNDQCVAAVFLTKL